MKLFISTIIAISALTSVSQAAFVSGGYDCRDKNGQFGWLEIETLENGTMNVHSAGDNIGLSFDKDGKTLHKVVKMESEDPADVQNFKLRASFNPKANQLIYSYEQELVTEDESLKKFKRVFTVRQAGNGQLNQIVTDFPVGRIGLPKTKSYSCIKHPDQEDRSGLMEGEERGDRDESSTVR